MAVRAFAVCQAFCGEVSNTILLNPHTNLCRKDCYCPHFLEEETGAQWNQGLSKITQRALGKALLRPLVLWLPSLGPNHTAAMMTSTPVGSLSKGRGARGGWQSLGVATS